MEFYVILKEMSGNDNDSVHAYFYDKDAIKKARELAENLEEDEDAVLFGYVFKAKSDDMLIKVAKFCL